MSDNKYLIGDIRIDGIEYSAEFLDFAEREKQGLVTEGEKQKLFPIGGYTITTEESREQQRQMRAEYAKRMGDKRKVQKTRTVIHSEGN